MDKYAHLATFDEIKDNDFNLNIPRYVDTFEPEPDVDIKQVAKKIRDLDQQITNSEQDLVAMLSQLTSDDQKVMEGLKDIINDFKGDK